MDKRKKPQSEEHRRKLSVANKGKKHPTTQGELNPAKRVEVREKISKALKGKKKSLEHIAKNRLVNTGKKASAETRKKMSLSQKERVASGKHHFWKGGVNKLHKSERNVIVASLEYKLWREAVFTRDNWACRFCGVRNGNIHADHIKPFCDYPELRFSIDNGRTLCVPCHRKTDTYGRPSSKSKPT